MKIPPVSVIGAGGWGTALALLMARRATATGHTIPLWGHDPALVDAMLRQRCNAKYLPGIELPPSIYPTGSLAEAAAAPVIFFAIPSKHLVAVAEKLAEEQAAAGGGAGKIIVSCTKGVEQERGLLMSELLAEKLSEATIAVLSGPNLAGEIARGIPAAGVIGSADREALPRVQELFEGTNFRPYTSGDERGIQLGGALKNIFAIAAGASDGLGLGENARAGIVTRSLAEMARLGVAMGGERETFRGLSGVGDLMVTCFSSQSRNHQVGFRLGRGERLSEIRDSMTMVAEGVPTTASAYACARRLGVETPIIDQVQALLLGEKTPAQAMKDLMSRQLRSEEEV
jgi:glycerol-3-phosphate dehydrogenase (NAD(P)+)